MSPEKGTYHATQGPHGEVPRFGQEAEGGVKGKPRPEPLLYFPQEKQSRENDLGD